MIGDTCLECGEKMARHAARGLCHPCYERHFRRRTLDRFPRRNRPAMAHSVVLAQYRELAYQGITVAEIAQRIGLSRNALYGHLARDRKQPKRLSEAEVARLRRMVGAA